MRVLVLYASKKGTTEYCANLVADKLQTNIINLNINNNPNLNNYDLIIIGTPLYIGRPVSIVRKFCQKQMKTLSSKKLAFFICGIGEPKQMIDSFKTVIPEVLTSKAITINHFGGEYRPNKCNFFERKILEKIISQEKLNPKVNNDEIERFIEIIREVRI